jgi:RNA polymerase sigma factor (sigma-70 family)
MTHTALASNENTVPQSTDAATRPVPPLDFNKLFREHRSHLVRFVQRFVRTTEDAEDVVQNTFIEAMRNADRFAGLSKPSTWLFGIALNMARNKVRSNGADRYEEVDESFMEELVDEHSDPARLIELREIAYKVEKLLDSMPSDLRATFNAVVEEDASYEEAAEKMKIPVGTVRSRVSRVRAAVREHCQS